MFDIGFTELLLCLVVALVVIGPEQLPGTVRTIGLWIGRLKRSLRDTRSEIERQIGADDIRRQLHNEEIMQSIEATRQQFQNSILESEQALDNKSAEVRERLALAAKHYGSPDELPDHAHSAPPTTQASASQPTNIKPVTTTDSGAPTTDNKSV